MSESNKSTLIPVDVLEDFMCTVFIRLGVPADDAQTCARVLITSDLRGIESHGIGRLKMYYQRIKTGIVNPLTQLDIIRETPSTALVDANHGLGMVAGVKSMQIAIEKARNVGMGSVAVRNSSHFGIDGYYPLMAVQAGMIGMSFTNARPSIAPTFGVQPMLGTNPIAFGAPTDEAFPFLFDAATSITQRGKIEVLSRVDKPVPDGWIIDNLGESINDPHQTLRDLTAEQAALLPLGGAGELLAGHKGYGLATIVEILSASLQNGAFLYGLTGIGSDGSPQPNALGHFFMAINIEAFTDLDSFKRTTGNMLRQLRAARKAPGQSRIYTAGEKEYELERKIRQQGVAVPPNLLDEILAIKEALGLSQFQF